MVLSAADRGRDGRPLVERRHRRHGPAGVADVHERELEHRADGDGDRRQRRPGRRRHRLQHRDRGARPARMANYNGINPADVSVTNTDNDASGITVSTISGPTTEAGGTATFTVVLDAQPTADVTVGPEHERRDRGHRAARVAHLHERQLEHRADRDRHGRQRRPGRRRHRLQHRDGGRDERGWRPTTGSTRPTSASRTPTTTRPGSRSRPSAAPRRKPAAPRPSPSSSMRSRPPT